MSSSPRRRNNSRTLAVRGPTNAALITSLVRTMSVNGNRGKNNGPFALPYYGFNAPRSGGLTPASSAGSNKPAPLSPSSSAQVLASVAANLNYGAQLSRAINAYVRTQHKTKKNARKQILPVFAKNWAQINLPAFVNTKGANGWRFWMTLVHPDREKRQGPNANNRRKRLNALFQEVSAGRANYLANIRRQENAEARRRRR